MGNTPQYTYTLANPADFTEDELRAGHAFGTVVSFEAVPEDPPTPFEVVLAADRETPKRLRRYSVRARDESGELVASTGFGIDPEFDDNPDMIGVSVTVRADHRRKGVGTQLFAWAVALAKKENRTRLISSTNGRLPAGEPFAATIGFEKKQANHVNRLMLADVDWPLMQKWAAEGPSRADGYELFGWDDDVPDEHMDKFLEAILVMNTAPRDDLEMNDFTVTAAEVRESEAVGKAAGYHSWQLVARHIESGGWAGIHDLSWAEHEPDIMNVGSTGVRPEHRGHALGKWLKAAMMLRVRDERPHVTEIRTGNADSNDAMLGINKEMGYQPWISATTWELSTDAAEAWLKRRGLDLPEV